MWRRRPRGRAARLRREPRLPTVFTGLLEPDAIVGALGAADVVVHPSLREIFPNAVGEAMACARAVVAVDGGGTAELIGRDGCSGLLVPPEDPDAMALAIGGLIEDPARRAAMGLAARRRIETEFPLARMVDGYERALGEVVGRSRTLTRLSRMATQLLLTYDFPPIGGGIARWMAELARRYPPGSLVVSTGQHPDSPDVDATFPNPVDRLPDLRAATPHHPGHPACGPAARRCWRSHRAEFIWCGNIKPAAYPAKWVMERVGSPSASCCTAATC